jgi:hypothetical protein
MRIPRLLRLGLPVLGALLIAAGAIAVTASATGLKLSTVAATSSPSPKPSASAGPKTSTASSACQAYLAHLASRLGVSPSKLDQAATAAAKDTLQDQVTKGTLTQAEADKVQAKLGSGSLCSAAVNGTGHPHRGDTTAAGLMGGYLPAAAAALGITDAQLKTDLKNGQSLSQIAAAHNVSEADFKTKVLATLKPKLDAMVAAGKLTQTQETEALNKFQQGDPPLWNSPKK